MYRTIQQTLLARIQAILLAKYDTTLTNLVVEQPPSIALGELALPVAFELAKRLRKAPRAIATELAAELTAALPELEGIASVEVAGAGYLNIRLDRAATVRRIAADQHADIGGPGFRLVEHTSINPNKAAHIGHLRNAILGDTFQRLLRHDTFKSGYEVGVQNYIDNTGVQVADVVVGLVHLEGKTLDTTRELLTELIETNQRIDFYCWDLYARVSQWYTADPGQLAARKQLRLDTLHALEAGNNDTAKIADLISTAVLRRHLETMQRLSIEYDFLPRESEILTLHFWDAARTLMLEKGVLYLETAGKNKGCYVMRRAGAAEAEEGTDIPDEDAKVIVRSNGTVTYVGKDIAYHLWKFGLLPGKDFGYKKFYEYPTHICWISTANTSDPGHPVFGHADHIYNVIDSRQNDPQSNVIAVSGSGAAEACDRAQQRSAAAAAKLTWRIVGGKHRGYRRIVGKRRDGTGDRVAIDQVPCSDRRLRRIDRKGAHPQPDGESRCQGDGKGDQRAREPEGSRRSLWRAFGRCPNGRHHGRRHRALLLLRDRAHHLGQGGLRLASLRAGAALRQMHGDGCVPCYGQFAVQVIDNFVGC